MLGFDKTVTIYNKWYDPAARTTRWLRTALHGVSWSGHQKVTTSEGLTSDDGYSVRIQLDAMPSGFLRRDEYAALPDPAGHWTAQNGDVIVLGEGPEAAGGIVEITKRRTECFTVTGVYTANMMRLLPHLRLEGK